LTALTIIQLSAAHVAVENCQQFTNPLSVTVAYQNIPWHHAASIYTTGSVDSTQQQMAYADNVGGLSYYVSTLYNITVSDLELSFSTCACICVYHYPYWILHVCDTNPIGTSHSLV